jgi:ubiquinone/menaquinone biosynthesis C-methylase UbiE
MELTIPSHIKNIPIHQLHDFNQRGRDEWVRMKAAVIPEGSRVLDVGAGTCPYRNLFNHCDYRTHDFKRYQGEKLGGTTEYGVIDYVSDVSAIPESSGFFDVILCTEVLEHVPEPIEALREISRLIRKGGVVLITAPLGSGLHQEPYHFYGGYTPHWYRHFGEKFGFRIAEVTPNGGFFRMLAQECNRAGSFLSRRSDIPREESEVMYSMLSEVLPRYFFGLEESDRIDSFTVGYHVEMVME